MFGEKISYEMNKECEEAEIKIHCFAITIRGIKVWQIPRIH